MQPQPPSDALLYAISAWGRLGWGEFKRIHQGLLALVDVGAVRDGISPYIAAQSLDMLAHCDLAFGSRGRMYVAPQLIVRMPVGGLPRALLTGARAPVTIPALEAASQSLGARVSISEHGANVPLLPARVAIEAPREDLLEDVAQAAGIEFESVPPAARLVEIAGNLDEYILRQPERSGQLVGWRSSWFDPVTLRFVSLGKRDSEARLARMVHPVTQQERCFWRRPGSWQEVDKDWGRYLALREMRLPALVYDPVRFILGVPLFAPMPRVFARALCLCSGWAPRVVNGSMVTGSFAGQAHKLFQWVPRGVAEMVAQKLGQPSLVFGKINV